ncbi:hypothetical protein LOAG_12072 [Loa loa]|uniref:Uncharacterized protein n=1 Tax=Loa loa TaxID=7209 RepID=A0A1S0TLV4_LOALO|nr:hypothetical protein LOAG_12072 [Loa loa]EFO16434.2 hypothetical protein LOAG_12072 [Loa loa]
MSKRFSVLQYYSLPLSSTLQTTVAAQQLPLSSTLQTNAVLQRLPLSSVLQANVTPQQLLPPSNPQTKVAAQRLLLPSNLLHAKTTTQSPSLPCTKSLQAINEFQQNLLYLRKIRLLQDQATHYARLAQDAWEEARAIASSLDIPPPSLPDAIDFMTHNYLKYRKEWNLSKKAEEQENIKPCLSQIVDLENSVSSHAIVSLSSGIQSTFERRKSNSVLDPSSNKFHAKMYRTNVSMMNVGTRMIDQQLSTTPLRQQPSQLS